MGTVSRVHTFASGAILTAAQLNNEFDNLLTSSAINGGLDATNLGVTAGQATASKALVVDASRNLADATGSNRINNLALSGTFESTGAITASAGITSGGNIVSDTDSTDDLGTTGVRWANLFVDDVTVTNNVTIGGTLTLTGGITLNGNTTIGDSSADTLTVNSTITSNLIFTDNTYDIGASGATRPRNLYLSGNGVVGGTLGVTGLITATGGVSGALTGNVTGNLTGDVTGNISGNVTGGTISGTTGTFSGDVAVNTSTLKVDTGNNRVGVKNASPSYPLDIGYTAGINQVAWRGSINEIGFLTFGSSTDAGAVQLSSGGAAKILFDAAGNSYINTGSNFSIGTASPSALLHLYKIGSTQAGLIETDQSASVLNFKSTGQTAGQPQIGCSGSNLILNTNGSERARITSTGAIEIPNQNAINELTFTGTDYTNIFSNTTGGMQFGTTGAGSYLALYAANAEAIHIDSSQRVGIGTSSPQNILHVKSAADNAYLEVESSAVNSNPGIRLTNDVQGWQWQLRGADSDSLVAWDVTGGVGRLYLTTSGNLGLGTSSPTSPGSTGRFMQISNSSGSAGINLDHTTHNSWDIYNYQGALGFYDETATRMTLDSSGNLLIGTTSTTIGTSSFGTAFLSTQQFAHSRNANGSSAVAQFFGNAGECRIKGDGDLENTNNSYGAISDERLKSDIVDASSQLADIKSVKIRKYILNENGETHIGVVAQELEAAGMEGLVDTDEDGYKSVKYSVLYVKAVKALQEAITKIETLETKVAALEAA